MSVFFAFRKQVIKFVNAIGCYLLILVTVHNKLIFNICCDKDIKLIHNLAVSVGVNLGRHNSMNKTLKLLCALCSHATD